MRKLLAIGLPYTFFLALGIAIWCANFRSQREPVVAGGTPAAADAIHCGGCGNEVDSSVAFSQDVGEQTQFYCCEHCFGNHQAAGFPIVEPLPMGRSSGQLKHAVNRLLDPVCKMEVTPAWGYSAIHQGQVHYFCTGACRDRFAESPHDFLGDRCVVCNQLVDPQSRVTATYMDRSYTLCCEDHRREFKADPAAFFMHVMWGIPSWMYYASIAAVMIVSFGAFEWIDRLASDRRLPADRLATDCLPTDRLAMEEAAPLPILNNPPFPEQSQANRFNLLEIKWIRTLVRSRFFRFTLQALMVVMFFVIIAAGLVGNQNPAMNIAPILTWTVWWGGLIILIMFAGKAWCYVCPWDAVAGWMEKFRLWGKNEEGLGLGLRWPRALRNVAAATALFVGLTWIELGFGVTMRPRVTAYLALGMLFLAIISAFLFEKKSFCRYACLVGRVSGLYAMFSGVEVRSKSASVCKSCRGKECVRGSETAYGCPTFLYPGGLANNTYCIQCAECIQACPEDNLALNLRPWGADLIANRKPRTDEAYLALLMLSITAFHGLTMTANWHALTDWLSEAFSLGKLLTFSLGMTALMVAPILVYAALAKISYDLGSSSLKDARLTYHDYFVRYAYALLPIALFYHLAHNLEHLLMEGPKVAALASDPFGWGWNLLGTATWTVPPLVSLDVLWALQILLVLVGHVYSLWVAQRTSIALFGDRKAAFRSQLPMLAGMICFSVFSLWLLKQPMEMRTSAM
ncbi:MAG: hypothetical protein N2C14_05185 [Planctomycetales bacterium]